MNTYRDVPNLFYVQLAMSAVPLIAGKASAFDCYILRMKKKNMKIGLFYFPEKPPVAPNVVAQASNKHSIPEVCTLPPFSPTNFTFGVFVI